ncbi:putative ribonuclease H-like domain-containing protein [Tanacetum coccineum]
MSEAEPIPPTSSVTALRIPMIKKGEYDLWSMKMRQYIAITDHILWDIITNGDQATTDPASSSVSAPKTSLAANARRNNEKALNILLSAIPDRHLLSFHDAEDAKTLWSAIKARFGGNEASKKMQKNLLKQQFETFTIGSREELDSAYERFQNILSMLELYEAKVSLEDANLKFLRSLPSVWHVVATMIRGQPGLDELEFDDLYNNLKVYEHELKGVSISSSQNIAFLSTEVKGSTLKQSTADPANIPKRYTQAPSSKVQTAPNCASHSDEIICSFFAQQASMPITHDDEDLLQIDEDAMEEIDIRWQVAMITARIRKFMRKTGRPIDLKPKNGITFDKFAKYQKTEQMIVRKRRLWLLKIQTQILGGKLNINEDIDWTKEFVAEQREKQKELDQVLKERDDFKVKLEKWTNASVLQNEVLNKQRYLSDKSCIGFGVESSSSENSDNSSGNTNSTESLYPNFQKAKGFHAVPPPTGTVIPPRANVSFTGIDELAIRNKVVNQENTKSSQPEIDRNKVIIEDWVDSDDEETGVNFSEIQKKTVVNSENSETFFENRSPSSQNSVGQGSRKKGLGHKRGKTCFVCYSPDHLIKDCDLHERTFKQTQTHQPKGKQGSRDTRPVWNNINRVNHSNFSGNSRYPHQKRSFIPSAVLTREGLKSTARPKMTQTVPSKSTANVFYQGTARPRVPQAVLSQSTGRPYYPRMDNIRPRTSSFSPSTRFSTTRTPHRPQRPKKIMKSIWVKKASTVGSQAVLPQNGNPEEDLKWLLWKRKKFTERNHQDIMRIDFEKVSYVEELKFNLLSVSQICDKKHNVLFTDKECLILSPKFKFVDEDLVILRAPRKNDVYSLDLRISFLSEEHSSLRFTFKAVMLDHSCLACRKGNSTGLLDKKIGRKNTVYCSWSKKINAIQNKHSEERTADKEVPLSSEEQALHDELEKRRIAIEKGKECVNSTFTLSTANTPSQSTGNTPTDSDDDVPKDGVFSTNSFDDENTDTEANGLKPTARRTSSIQATRCISGYYVTYQMGYRQEEGVDYDEVFAPVARIEAIRLFLAFASFMGFTVYQMDVKSAFLYGNITEEVYVKQPPGFEDPSHPNKVYRVVKALYGLHQAPRAWYERLSTFLLKHGYRRGAIDKTLFIKKDRRDIMLVQVYVDDIIFGSTKSSMVKDFEDLMQKEFKMSSMGELTFFLGLQVKQTTAGIFLSQDKYVKDILNKFDFRTIKPASTPIEAHKSLGKDEEGEEVDVHLYRSMIGCLMYLTASRPDIMFAVCLCARFQVTPKVSHMHAVKRIFRYLKHQPKLGLWYPKDSPFHLEAFSDSDYAGDNHDRRSTSGGCQYLGRRLVSWQCKKQTIVAISSTEAEYVAAASCCAQVLWMQNQLLDYGFNFMNTEIHIDNESTICIVKNPVLHSKTKHIQIRHHFIRDCYEQRLINVVKVHTDDNVADLLTKGFDLARFNFLVVTIGMMNP